MMSSVKSLSSCTRSSMSRRVHKTTSIVRWILYARYGSILSKNYFGNYRAVMEVNIFLLQFRTSLYENILFP